MIELMLFITMLGAIFAGHYAQRCFHMAREIRDELRRQRRQSTMVLETPPTDES